MMTVSALLLATALVVPTMPVPEHDNCEVVTNCVFDALRHDARIFSIRMEIDTTPANGVEVVFGRDADNHLKDILQNEFIKNGVSCLAKDEQMLFMEDLAKRARFTPEERKDAEALFTSRGSSSQPIEP